MTLARSLILSVLTLVLAGLALAASPTIENKILPPEGYKRTPVAAGTFAATLRALPLSEKTELTLGDGKTVLCGEDFVAATMIEPFDNKNDVGMDGFVRLWGEYVWNHHPKGGIAFPLDNGQRASWDDWKDGLRPVKKGGRFIFTQNTTPSGGAGLYQQFLGFVAEEMGAIAISRESAMVLFEDSLAVGDLIVSVGKNNESRVGILLDACKGPRGERLYLVGSCGTPSTSLYVMKPYSPVQGLNEWFTLEGARWAIGQGAKTDLRRVALSR